MTQRTGLDRLDRKLLAAVQKDAARTNAALAEEIGLSPSSCLRRLQRLKAEGVLLKTVALVAPAALGRTLSAIVEVELDRHGEQHLRRFLERARGEAAVTHAYAVTGEIDVILMLRLVDMAEFHQICERLFRDATNVARFKTMFVTQTGKEETALPVP
ncbi:Lrp/AsnC family transcriptional regulator [Stappia indica]|uniref:Lrp/AsnC family transcriptional regulator n=1 Tax=Stappia indica TaxID=538381 RepID=UPI001CD5165E|nr:Lrp/AsnC family transcriptional regulator [Stappia indica]MCA1299017.1 Lrp/AsnC family transcriptional regulator [Stappia indica]